MTLRPLINSMRYSLRRLTSRRIYVVMMIVLPLAATFFFLNLMDSGLPTPVPVAVVDMDHSSMSRQLMRTLGSSQTTTIVGEEESYYKAIESVRRGETMGFFYIPQGFQKKALSGGQPTMSFYCNLTYFVPGSLAFKGFKTVAVSTTGGIVEAKLIGVGLPDGAAGAMIQPVVINQNLIGNPWLNYNYYLSVSFIFALLALLVAQVTSATIMYEVKDGTSPRWLQESGGSMFVALTGKLLPQTVIWSIVGLVIELIIFKFNHFPLNNHFSHMIAAMVLMVIACQSFAVIMCWMLPNLRLAVTLCSLIGILTFSVAAISFPVPSMYGAVGIFSYILPFRYFFLIFSDQALNGIPIYFSRYYYVALLIFPLVAMIGIKRIKTRCLNPIYVP